MAGVSNFSCGEYLFLSEYYLNFLIKRKYNFPKIVVQFINKKLPNGELLPFFIKKCLKMTK